MVKEILAVYLLRKLLGKERTNKLDGVVEKYITKVTAIILGFVVIFQMLRFALGFDVSVADWSIPLWVGYIVAIVAGYLGFGLWKK